jgi:hypothetical protein
VSPHAPQVRLLRTVGLNQSRTGRIRSFLLVF